MPSPIEARRLLELESYDILDTPREAAFDDITRMATVICGTPMALITLVDRERQWFKSEIGLGMSQTTIDDSICAHAIQEEDVLVVQDATTDPRFATNSLVVGNPKLKFYAGARITTSGGITLGTVCVMDTVGRTLDEAQIDALRALARQVMMQLELRKMLKLSEQTSNHRGQLLGDAGHDLRQPLFVAMLAVQALMPGALQHQTKRLKMADEALEAMKLGFNRLLTAAGRRSTFTGLGFADTRLDGVIGCIRGNFQSAAVHKHVQLRVVNTRLRVNSDAKQLETIVGNLTNNAIKYTPPGGRVLVGCRRRKAHIEIHVIDTGIGMASGAVSGFFDAFRQADLKSDGLGLGLWIVKHTAELLGIVVQIRSTPGKGSHFTLRIPRGVNDDVPREQAIQIL